MTDYTRLTWEWDKIYEMQVEAGLSEDGKNEIRRSVWKNFKIRMPDDFFDKKSETSWAKRIAKFLGENGMSVNSSYITYVGNIASENSALKDFKTRFRFVKRINWKAGEYGDDNSCFWGEKRQAIPLIHHYGGYALQFLNAEGKGIGRCLCVTLGDGAMLIFNSYGKLCEEDVLGPSESGVSRGRQDAKAVIVAQVLAKFFNTNYKGIRLSNFGKDQGTMYINSGRGFMIGDNIHNTYVSSYDLEWDESALPKCNSCGRLTAAEDLVVPPARLKERAGWSGSFRLCKSCLEDKMRKCVVCEEQFFAEEGIANTTGLAVCSKKCASTAGLRSCSNCNTWSSPDNLVMTPNRNQWFCWGCANRYALTCGKCWTLTPRRTMHVMEVQHAGDKVKYHVRVCEKCYGAKEGAADKDPKVVTKKRKPG